MTDLLELYQQTEKAIHDYFGFKEQWRVFPIEDNTEYFWDLDRDKVIFWDSLQQAKEQNYEPNYEDEIISSDKGRMIYERENYTAIVVDTNTDGNKFFAIFDNKMRLYTK